MENNIKKILFSIILFFAFVYSLLIMWNKIPPAWDEAWYLSTSVRLYRNLVLGNLFIFLKAFSQAFGGDKAPLISILPIPFYLIFGTSYISAMLVNISLVIILSLFTFKLVNYIEKNNFAALYSIIIVNTMPLFHNFARQFMVEYGLSVLVLLTLYFLLRSEYLIKNKYIYILGVILGLGLLMKSLYLFYLIGPIIYYFVSNIKNFKKAKELIKKIFKIILIGSAIASIWYIPNFKKVLLYGFSSGYGKFSGWYSLGNIFSITTVMRYFKDFVYNGISLFYFIIFLAFLFIFIIKRKSQTFRFKYDVLIFIWFLFPFLILLFAPNKILRFLLPALTPIAIVLGIWLNRIFKKSCLFLLTLSLLVFILNPFIHSPLLNAFFSPPLIDTNSDWKINEVIDSIPFRDKSSHLVLCAVDHEYYNNFTLGYYSVLKWAPYRFINSNFCRNFDEVKFLIDKIDFILVKTGYLGPDFCNKFSSQIREIILNNKTLFKEIQSFFLPDGSSILIFERLSRD